MDQYIFSNIFFNFNDSEASANQILLQNLDFTNNIYSYSPPPSLLKEGSHSLAQLTKRERTCTYLILDLIAVCF